MRLAGIDKCELCNGNDIGISLYVQGCDAHCKNCFNPETWDFGGGVRFSAATERDFFESMNKPYIKRVAFLGGEPLDKRNAPTVLRLIEKVRCKTPIKSIWVYTGYKLEDLEFSCDESVRKILSLIDVLVDGRYVDELRDLSLPFRGSSNQRIIDMTEWRNAIE